MKQAYQKPAILLENIQMIGFVCNSNEVIRTDGNSDIDYGGSGNNPVHVKSQSIWDEEGANDAY